MPTSDPNPFMLQGQWPQAATVGGFVPTITTSGTTNIYYGTQLAPPPPEPVREEGPFEWLRGQVDEICELAAAA